MIELKKSGKTKEYLQEQIKANIREIPRTYKHRGQAIASAYSQTRKVFPRAKIGRKAGR